MLIRRYESAQLGDYFYSELHLLADGIRYIIFVADIYKPDIGEKTETAEVVETRLKTLAANTRAYTDAATVGPGFCVNGVVINDQHDDERAKFDFESDFRKDTGFEINVQSLVVENEGLHARAARQMQGAPLAFLAGFHTLRKDVRQVAGMTAEESLHYYTENKAKNQLFVIETRRDNPGYERPRIQLEMSTGGRLNTGEYVSTSMSNDEALHLWDRIVSSIRLRPGAAGSTDQRGNNG